MLQGRELVLATNEYAKDVKIKSWLATLSTLVVLGMGFFVSLSPFPIAVRIISSVFTGLVIVRFFVIYHDYVHGSILQKSLPARIVFSIFGLYFLAPISIWKRSHNYHHDHNSKLYTSSIGSFPIVTKEKYKKLNKPQQFTYLFIRHPLTIFLGYFFAFTWGMCFLSLYRSPSKHWDSAVSLLFHFGIGALVLFFLGPISFFLGFFIPSFIASAMGSYLFYAQHNFPGVTFENQKDWTYIGAALNSSSYMKMGIFMRWFTANIGYHHIHHTNSRIPFYNLPVVYKRFKEFQDPKTTSLNPVEIIRCLKLKVWDPEARKMIKLTEIQ